jgi:uncharacterized protein YcbK (DUF882 family)
MGDLSLHFHRREFACKCGCGFDGISPALVKVLEKIRAELGAPIHVVSGCRCAKRNAAVGGVKHSQHVLGTASDITADGKPPKQVHAVAARVLGNTGGLGLYPTFVHVDVRQNGPARWAG